MNSDGFVTQLDGGLPRLLVISLQLDFSWLPHVIEAASGFGLHGELAALENLENTKLDEVYKAVCIVPIPEIESFIEHIVNHADVLRKIPRVVIVLYGAQWQIIAQQETWNNYLQKISDISPNASIVVLVDCVEVGVATPLLEQWRRPLMEPTGEIIVEDTGYTVFPMSFETMVSRLQDLLVRPLSPGWFLVRGEASTQLVVLQALCAGVASLGTPPPRIESTTSPQPSQLLPSTVLIEGEVSTASKSIQLVLKSAVTSFVNSFEKLPIATPKREERPLPRPQLIEQRQIEQRHTEQRQKVLFRPELTNTAKPKQDSVAATVTQTPEISSVENRERQEVVKTVQEQIKSTEKTTVDLDKAVSTLFAQERFEEKSTHIKNTTKQTKAMVHKLKRRKRVYWGGLVLLGITLAVLFVGGVFTGTYWLVSRNLDVSIVHLTENSLISDQNENANKETKLNDFLIWQANTLNALFSLEVFDDAQRLASLAKLTTTVPIDLAGWENNVAAWTSKALSGESAPKLEELTALNTQEEQLYADISGVSAGLKAISSNDLPKANGEVLQKFDATLSKTRKQLSAFQQLTPLLPELLGYQQPKTYALLFQNPQELRPTGGFLQSVALVTFDKGLLTDIQVVSTYELDKNLLGVVSPPADLQRFLGEQRWFLRDANWSGDYPTSASNISWFIEQTARRPVSGVISIDAYTWQSVIKALGPIEVPEYNEVITDKNVLERLEFHSELIFDQGQPKTEYSTLLFSKILNKLKTANTSQMKAVLKGLGEKTISGNVLVWLKQNAEASVMANLGLDGALLSPSCPDQLLADNCLVETVAQVEANVGVNKANAHLDKTTVHNVVITKSQVQHTRTTTYKNNATSTAWPKGAYKAYVRWYLSPTSLNPSIFVGQNPIPQDQLFFGEEKGKKVVGALIEVPVQGTTQLSLKYNTTLPYQSNFSYALFSQRQPGLAKNNENVIITHEINNKPKIIIPQASISGSTITFANNITDGHTYVGVAFE